MPSLMAYAGAPPARCRPVTSLITKTNGSRQGTIGLYGYCASADDTYGGVESQIRHVAVALAASGWRVVIHCLSTPRAGWHVADGKFAVGSRTRQVADGVLEFVPAHGPGFEGTVAENVATSVENHEQMILAFGTRDGWVFDVAFTAADHLGVPVVSFVYFTVEERWYRAQFTSRTRSVAGLADAIERAELADRSFEVLRRVLERSQLVIVPTDYVRGQLAALADPPDATKVAVVYHGVDPQLFIKGPQPWQPGRTWLHVSRLSVPFAGHKNLAWSCEFLHAAHDLNPVPHLKVCGSGNAAGLVADFKEQNDLHNRITVTGFLDQQSLAAEMREATLLLVPSMMEAGCTVIVEAVMSGCLPVAVDFAGAGEMLRSLGLADFLVTPTVQDFGNGVRTVVPDTGHARQVVTDAYRHPEQVNDRLRRAAEITAARFSLAATTEALTRRMPLGQTEPVTTSQAAPA